MECLHSDPSTKCKKYILDSAWHLGFFHICVKFLRAQKITNLGKLPSEQKRKTPKRQKKIKIIKENSQVKKENSQALK